MYRMILSVMLMVAGSSGLYGAVVYGESRVIANSAELRAVEAEAMRYGVSEADSRVWAMSIVSWSHEYGIDRSVVMAVIGVECGYDVRAEHDGVRVMTRRGMEHVSAVGAGVIYEIWDVELRGIGVMRRENLLYIDTNVMAVCHILSVLRDRRQLVGSVSVQESMLMRYYGVVRKDGAIDRGYVNRVYAAADKIQ